MLRSIKSKLSPRSDYFYPVISKTMAAARPSLKCSSSHKASCSCSKMKFTMEIHLLSPLVRNVTFCPPDQPNVSDLPRRRLNLLHRDPAGIGSPSAAPRGQEAPPPPGRRQSKRVQKHVLASPSPTTTC